MIQRRGLSLIEMLVVMTVSVAVVGLVAGMIRLLMKADRAAEDHLVRSGAVDQLSDSFRQHVRAAREAKTVQQDGADKLQLKLDEARTVEFLAREQVVIRSEREAGQIRRQDRYTVPVGSAVRFEVQSDEKSTTVSLVLARRLGQPDRGPPRELRVHAMLGRDLRFVAKGD